MDVNLSVWNVRGLNCRARRTAIHELVWSERVSLLCLQEAKLDVVDRTLILDMLGLDFDYYALPAVHSCGGFLVAWDIGMFPAPHWALTQSLSRSSPGMRQCNNGS
uniref:Endonuclease/exonuclease/phosphatase domain-containing protein n=1 Tax=Setaria viridis TaxID=4556 RepID=A0A4U6TB62_SETVI|nr:hypothetical protein SEVIR_9G285200v2 [Setaria viridis]